jgi:Mrp family chromosome partitioning ATPase
VEAKRIVKIIGDRWVVVLTGAIVGLIGALAFLAFASPRTTVWEATAALRFDPAEGQTAQALAQELTSAHDFAMSVAEETLAKDPTSQISVDLANFKLLFVSQASTEEEALSKAEALREAYLRVDPEAGAPVDDQIAALLESAKVLDAQIADLQPELTAEQKALLAKQQQLDATIASVETRLESMVLDEAAARTAEEQNALATERSRLEASLETLQAQREELGDEPVAELSSEDSLLLGALQARKELLNTEYQRLYLRKLGVAGRGVPEAAVAQDFLSDPIAPVFVALIGLVGGAIVAATGLMMISRTRRTVWLPEDMEVPVLGHIPARPVEARGSEAWYDTTDLGPRKTAVQALRSAVQAYAHSTGSTIALAGHNIASEDVHALAADLAGSMASAGDTVLLVDANFASRSTLGEYRVKGTSLSDVLRIQPTSPDIGIAIDRAVTNAQVIRPGLSVVPAGPPPGSPADALAGRQFRSFVAAAERKYDTTIFVVDDFGTPSSQVAMQRLRHGVLVTSPGATTETEVNGLIDDTERLRISVAGAVFLGTRRRLSGLFRKSKEEPRNPLPEEEEEAGEDYPFASPMTRLNNYAIPDERRTALVQHSPLGELASSFGFEDGDAESSVDLGGLLVAAISHASPERASSAVADYVVSRTEDMVTARYGYGDIMENLIHDVSENGFLPLRPINGHRTVGAWLIQEIEREVDSTPGSEIVNQFERLLTGADSDDTVDDWLEQEFFRRHLERTGGEPEVWHLASPHRAVSILVPARRLNAERLESALTDIVSNTIDELERKRSSAEASSDQETVEECEDLVADVRLFEDNLRSVLYGDESSGSKRVRSVAWNPDWSHGTRANLAAFQRLGLLPFSVLSDKEMTALMATA